MCAARAKTVRKSFGTPARVKGRPDESLVSQGLSRRSGVRGFLRFGEKGAAR